VSRLQRVTAVLKAHTKAAWLPTLATSGLHSASGSGVVGVTGAQGPEKIRMGHPPYDEGERMGQIVSDRCLLNLSKRRSRKLLGQDVVESPWPQCPYPVKEKTDPGTAHSIIMADP
jgi:hypothetical protein